MSIFALIKEAHERGVRLWEENGQLRLKAPKGALTPDIRERLIANKSELVEFLRHLATTSKVPPIQPVDREGLDSIPLSYAQERLWFINQLEPGSSGYNVPGAVRIRGELDIEQLEQAFAQVIARHENLRTVFPSEEGRARQRILERLEFKLRRVEMDRHESVEERRRQAREYCQQEAGRAFDLAQGPLIRGHVLRIQDQEHILMLNLHHIISDGWSIGVLVKELGQIMRGQRDGSPVELAPLPIQYVDYSLWQRKRLEEGGLLEQQLQYWQEKLAGVPESVDLAHDYPRPAVQSFAGATRGFSVDAQLTGQLKRLSEEHGCTLYMTLLAVFKVLLYRYTGQEDLCVGSPIANRQYAETEGLIGMFVNTLALRSQVRAQESFAELLGQVRQTCLEAYEHQDAPFEKVVERVRPQRNMAISPLFQVMVVLQNLDMGEADELIEVYGLDSGISKFDLSVEFTETSHGLAGAIEYSTGLYRSRTIEQMVGHFLGLCRAVIAAPGNPIGQLQYLQEPQRRRVVQEFNATQASYPSERCIHQLFAEQVALDGERPAVRYGDEVLSYRQLWERSRELGVYLQSLGVGPDSLVGLCVERSLEMVVGLLGILQAGGAYVPLDPDYPPERLGYMLRDTGARVVLTQAGLRERLSGMVDAQTRVIELDRPWQGPAGVELREEVRSHHLAYVIYTSGSTGTPKGVQIEHRSLVNHNSAARKLYGITAEDVQVQFSSMGFDLFLEEVFVVLNSGAELVLESKEHLLTPQYFSRLLAERKITTLNVPTAFFHQMVASEFELPGIRTVIVGGERLEAERVREFQRRYPQVALYNTYGPTETTIISTATRVSGERLDRHGSVSIGRPIDNTQIYILDAQLNPQPVGVPGELYIAGAGLARGYLNRPELTQERFVSNPFIPGERMYRSGDRARWLEDGHIEYLGRVDTQVKIRGFRIEMGEIEARLNQHPQIRESVVVAQEQESGKRLVAFYRAQQSEVGRLVTLGREEIRSHLSQVLPAYMVPETYVSVAAIPMTAHGKVDRLGLERMEVEVESGKEYLAPRTEMEQQLVEIWGQVLGLKPHKIGVHDSFFELGGHSLSAVQLIAKTNAHFGQSIPLATLFAAPDIASLATVLSSKQVRAFDILVPVQTRGDAIPIFAVPGVGGNVLSWQPLCKLLGDSQPFYALQAAGLDGTRAPFESVEETAEANIAALKKIQDTGPYRLIGHSYGGVVAYEMTRKLLEWGEVVDSLVLLDSIAPAAIPADCAQDESADLKELRDATHGIPLNPRQIAAFLKVVMANERCYRTYKPRELSGPVDVSLYRATATVRETPSLPIHYGWYGLLRSPVRIRDVEATHFSLLARPSIETVIDCSYRQA